MDYIKDIKKYEKLGEDNDDINIIGQKEFEEKCDELINDEFLSIKFSEENFVDNKLYVD